MAGISKGQFEIRTAQIEGEIRGVELEILECKLEVKRNHLEAAKIDVETSREAVRKAQLSLKQAQVSNDIQEEKLRQLEDQLKFETAMTLYNQEMMMIQGKSALLALEKAKQEFDENNALFEIG